MEENVKTTKELQQELTNINGLTWIPWIGDNFGNGPTKQKILFVGESHYYDKPEDKKVYCDERITQNIVYDMAIRGNNHKSPFFKNIHRMIFSTNNLTKGERENFWGNISFYNFVQEPMNTKKGRPSKAEFEECWRVFYQLISIMKPTACIFLGVTAGNFYKIGSKHKQQFSLTNHKWGDAIFGRARSIYLELRKPMEDPVQLYFVKHPSNFFSPDKCRKFLRSRDSEMMEFLKIRKGA